MDKGFSFNYVTKILFLPATFSQLNVTRAETVHTTSRESGN
jgi:hypothetical protein